MLALVLAVVATYVLLAGSPLIEGVPDKLAGVAITVLFIFTTMAVAMAASRLTMSWLAEALGLLLGLGLWFVVAGVGEEGSTLRLATIPAADVVFLVACVLAGRLLSRIVGERNLLLPVAVVLGLADVFTVFMGPVAAVLANAPGVVTSLSIKVPQVGSAVGPEGAAGLTHLATMGPGDLVFAALLFTAVVRFGLNLRWTFVGILTPVTLALVGFVLMPEALPGVPVLPLMAVGFLAVNYRKFTFTSEEKRNLVIAGVFVLVLLAVMWFVTHSMLPAPVEGEQSIETSALHPGGYIDARYV